jgi:hypothetical protein
MTGTSNVKMSISGDAKNFEINATGHYFKGLDSGTYSNILYYDTVSGEIKYGAAPTGGGMVYPGAGIPVSTGSAWNSSIVNNSDNWNTAFGWGNHATAGYLTSALTGAVSLGGIGISGNDIYLSYANCSGGIPSTTEYMFSSAGGSSIRSFTIATLATLIGGGGSYTHPTYPGDDINVDTGALTGAVVVSDIDINVTTDTLGHVTDANGLIYTRTLTLADLGYTGVTNADRYNG